MEGQAAIINISGDVTAVTGFSVEEAHNREDVQGAERIVMKFIPPFLSGLILS